MMCAIIDGMNAIPLRRAGGVYFVPQSSAESDERSLRGLHAIALAWQTGGLYARLWTILHGMKRDAPSATEARARLQQAQTELRC